MKELAMFLSLIGFLRAFSREPPRRIRRGHTGDTLRIPFYVHFPSLIAGICIALIIFSENVLGPPIWRLWFE